MMRGAFFLIAALAAAGAGWYFLDGIVSPRVTVVLPWRGEAVEAIYATGTVEGTRMLPLAAKTAARLRELAVDEGDRFAQGDVLARLEADDLTAAVEELKAREEYARRAYERSAALLRKNAASREDYDRAWSEWGAAQAAVKTAQAQVEQLRLVGPFDGRVIRREGELGQLIPSGEPVLWITSNEPLRITAEVDEEDIGAVLVGQTVLIRADAFPDQVFEGTVSEITPKGDPVARSYRVRITFDGDVPFRIGMTIENNIIIRETANALLVPASAVLQGKVWVVRSGRLRRVPVAVGARDPRQAEILDGLEPHDAVVLDPDDTLEEGARVQTVPAAPAAQ